MRGEFIGVWSESWREIWSKLAKHPKAPNDLFSELYRELVSVFIVPPNQTLDEKNFAEKRFVEIVSDPAQARVAFMKIKSKNLRGERFIVEFFESAYDVLEDLGGDLLANRYFNLVSAFIDKYSLRYNLREPCCLSPTLSGIFTNLMRELKVVTSKDAHLNSCMQDFEEAICDLRIDCSHRRIKACLREQFILLEAIGSKYLGKDGQTLGNICDKINWPHSALKKALSGIYGFASDYPAFRHGGNPNSVNRDIDMREMVVMSIILAGFTLYLTDQINADIIYRGEL